MDSKLVNLELKIIRDIISTSNFKSENHYLPDFFNGELVGVKFQALYGGVSEILLPDGGVPSIN